MQETRVNINLDGYASARPSHITSRALTGTSPAVAQLDAGAMHMAVDVQTA